MPAYFTTLWQSAINKCFNNTSYLERLITNGKQLRGWLDQDIKSKWRWWSAPNKDRIYRRNSGNWSFYCKIVVDFTTTMMYRPCL